MDIIFIIKKDINLKKRLKLKVTKLKGETEKDIALTLLNLPNILEKSIETKTLNEIAEYLYRLTAYYNKFYAENKILTEKDNNLKNSWIALTEVVYKTNQLLLNVLGIIVPDKM